MDTPIGKLTLTKNQIDNLVSLDLDFIKGVSYREDGSIVAVSEKELTREQILLVKEKITLLPNEVDLTKEYVARNRKRAFLERMGWTKEDWAELVLMIRSER